MKIKYEQDLERTYVDNIPLESFKGKENLDKAIDWITLGNSELWLRFDTGEAPSGCMWGPCHLPIGYWLCYGIKVEVKDLHTKLIHQDNLTTLLASNRELLFYRWIDPRDKIYLERLKSLRGNIDEINPGKDFFHSRFFGSMEPFTRYRKLKEGFGHKDITKYYQRHIEKLGNLDINACYRGDVREAYKNNQTHSN